jgi:hypothetical protein
VSNAEVFMPHEHVTDPNDRRPEPRGRWIRDDRPPPPPPPRDRGHSGASRNRGVLNRQKGR